MATVVKMCDMPAKIAATVFEMLNDSVRLEQKQLTSVIITDIEPNKLTYPEGWYYAKGCFRNKSTSTTGLYEELIMLKSNGDFWEDFAKYCTLND